MILTIGDREFKIWWKHHVTAKEDIELDERGMITNASNTVCVIYSDKGLVNGNGVSTIRVEGKAVLNIKDRFDPNKGRKESLTKALAQVIRFASMDRKLVWDAYYAMRNNNW